MMQSIPRDEGVLVVADINRHFRGGNRGDKEVMGRSGVLSSNAEGQMV